MRKINTWYQNEMPHAVLVDRRLAQLVHKFGVEEVREEINRPGTSHSETLNIHLNNLILTFSREMVDNMFKTIYGQPAFKWSKIFPRRKHVRTS